MLRVWSILLDAAVCPRVRLRACRIKHVYGPGRSFERRQRLSPEKTADTERDAGAYFRNLLLEVADDLAQILQLSGSEPACRLLLEQSLTDFLGPAAEKLVKQIRKGSGTRLDGTGLDLYRGHAFASVIQVEIIALD